MPAFVPPALHAPLLPVLFLLAAVLLAACQPSSPAMPEDETIRDLIRPVEVEAGAGKTFAEADLFFTTAAEVRFGDHPDIAVAHDAEAATVTLTPRADFEGLALVPFEAGGLGYVLPVRSVVVPRVTFAYPADADAEVHVIGSFNGWARGQDRLTDPQGDGIFTTLLSIPPGRYPYKFTADGEEVMDPKNPEREPNGFGSYNNILTVPPRHASAFRLRPLGWDHDDATLTLRAQAARTNPEGVALDVLLHEDDVIALLDNDALPARRFTVEGDTITVTLPTADLNDTHTIRLAVQQRGQATAFLHIPLWNAAPAGALTDAGGTAPFSWHDAVLYQILLDRFHDGDPDNTRPVEHDSLLTPANVHGGDLRGILDKLRDGYFDDLGVTALWLSPVVQNTPDAYREYPAPHRYYSAYHGYWPTDSYAVEPRFGDMETLQTLIDEAHTRGMKVLLDFVANHVHEQHPWATEHPDWFTDLDLPDGRKNLRLWDEQRLTTWFEPYLPTIDYTKPEPLAAMTDNAVWWLRETGADGFRHDAVKHIPNAFWQTLTRKIRTEVDAERDLPAYQIGETFGSYALISSYVTPGQLDAQFNFNLYDAALAAFLRPDGSLAALDAEHTKTLAVYGPHHLMGNLMDSHDKTRFAAYADGDLSLDDAYAATGWLGDDAPRVDNAATYDRIALYQAYQLTIPGVPVIYYGDEIGMSGGNDPDNRRPMRFDDAVTADEAVLRDRIAALVTLRRDRSALRHGSFETLRATTDLWAYVRADLTDRVLVVLNKSARAQTLMLDVPAAYLRDRAADALTGDALDLDDTQLRLTVPAGGYRIVDLL